MRLSRMLAVSATALFALLACSSDRMLNSWTAPSVKKLSFERIVAIAMTTDGPTRRLAEAEMVQIIGPKAVASSEVIPDADVKDVDKVRARLTAAGFDGAITMRLVDATTKVVNSRDPDRTYTRELWGYYSFVWINDTTPIDYQSLEQKLQIQTNIYSVKDGELLWSGTSEVMQPQLVETLVKDVATMVSRQLKSEGLI